MKKVGIIIEIRDGAIKDANYGMITCARQGGAEELYAFLINGNAQHSKPSLEAYGIHHIVDISLSSGSGDADPPTSGGADVPTSEKATRLTTGEIDQPTGTWNPMQWVEAIIQAMQTHGISTLFGLTSPVGRELLPRIAAKLDAPLVMDCIDVDCRRGIAQNYLYSGKTLAKSQVKGETQIYGIRPNVLAAVPESTSADIISLMFKEEGTHKNIRLLESKAGEGAGDDLLEADVIISGGRAMKNGENFTLLSECAHYLGAKVGASRVAVDLGWVPYSMQVGQTGEKVSPKVYIACGISGSVQHFAGMKMSGMIIAINTSPNAAIMSNCDYFIEGDLFEVIPALTAALKK